MEHDEVTLSNLCGGAVEEVFQHEWAATWRTSDADSEAIGKILTLGRPNA